MEITNPSSLPCQPLADLSGKARDYALCKVLWWTRTLGNLHCHNVKCSPYSRALVFFLWDTRGWRSATAFLWEQMYPRSSIPSETPQFSHFMTCFFLSLASSKHSTTSFASVSHWLTTWRWPILSPFCTSLLAGKKLLYHALVYILSPFFLLLLLLLARKMIFSSACCNFYMRAFKIFLTGMHSAL